MIRGKRVYTAQYFVGLAFCTLPLSPLMVRGGGEHGETEGIRFRYDESEIGRDNPPFHFPPLHKGGGCLVGIPSLHKGAVWSVFPLCTREPGSGGCGGAPHSHVSLGKRGAAIWRSSAPRARGRLSVKFSANHSHRFFVKKTV